MKKKHPVYFRYRPPHVSRSWLLSPPGSSQSSQSQSGLSSNSCPVFIWPLWPNLMDSAPLSPAVTSHPGSPPSTGGLDPGWQPSTGEPFPYSLSITGDPPYLSLATNGTPVNTIDTLTKVNKMQVQLICIWPPAAAQQPSKASLPFSPWRPGDAYRWFSNAASNNV